jgi:hypothetical protein
MYGAATSSDREADEFELRLHKKSATRGFLLAGGLLLFATVSVALRGPIWVLVAVVPAVFFIISAVTHLDKAKKLEQQLRFGPGPGAVAPLPPALGRGSKAAVRWTDGRLYPGFVMEVRGPQVLVRFPDGRQEWVPSQNVSPG